MIISSHEHQPLAVNNLDGGFMMVMLGRNVKVISLCDDCCIMQE